MYQTSVYRRTWTDTFSWSSHPCAATASRSTSGRLTNRGVELLAIWRLSQFLAAGSYTRVRSRDDEGVVPLAPRHGAGRTINGGARIAF
jgi:hypothetical protein